MNVINVPHVGRWKCRTQKLPKNYHLCTIAQLGLAISSQLRHVSTIGKKLVKQQYPPACPHNMVNFGPAMAEICWRVEITPANFNRFRFLAALLHDTLVVGVSHYGVELMTPPIFGRAAITLGIGPHSSLFVYFIVCMRVCVCVCVSVSGWAGCLLIQRSRRQWRAHTSGLRACQSLRWR